MLFISNNMVSKNKMECSLNILIEYDVLSLFLWFMIRWQKSVQTNLLVGSVTCLSAIGLSF